MKYIPRIVCSVAAIVPILSFFLNVPLLHQWEKIFTNWGITIAAFALGLGAINLGKRHAERIMQRRKGEWGYSAVCLGFLVVMTVIGIVGSTGNPVYMYWFSAVIESCQASVSALIIFYIATSAFRAFRARNIDSTLMLVAGVVAMLGQAPVGESIHRSLPGAATWLMNVINVGGQRGILISAALGAIAAALRIIIGVERGPFGKVN